MTTHTAITVHQHGEVTDITVTDHSNAHAAHAALCRELGKVKASGGVVLKALVHEVKVKEPTA